jgi:tetratricopeptide (TPR) repeat protein
MPFTLNGVGTQYYGRKNEQSRTATCVRCGKESRLSSFDTWHCVCLLFVPVLPLGRRRVLDSCSLCTAHRALSLSRWRALKRETLEQAMKRVKDAPADPQAQIDLHQACVFFGEPEKADALQLKMEEDFPRDARVHLYLAVSLSDRGREAEAVRALQRAREIDPAIPAAPAPRPPAKVVKSRRQRVVLTALALILVGLFSVSSISSGRSRTLHVVNGFDETVTVEWDGQAPFEVAPHGRLTRTLPEGSYVARVRGPLVAEHPFAIEGNFFTRLFDKRTFVLNPGGEAVVLHETAVYSARPVAGPPRRQVVYGEPFSTFRGVDFPFQPFPYEIKTESSRVEKTRVDVVPGGVEDAFDYLTLRGAHEEALGLAEQALRARPRPRSDLAQSYASLATFHGRADRALAALQELRARRPVEVPVHRAYQTLRPAGSPELPAEYDALLQAAPEDSALLYLRGRLEARNSKAREYFERALRSDPANAWAHAAAAHACASAGDWERARAAIEKACALRPESADFLELHRLTRLALQDYEALAKELTEQSHRDFLLPPLHEFLVRLHVAAGRKEDAQTVGREYLDRLKGRRERNAPEIILQFRATLFYALEDFEALAGVGPEHRPTALLEQGKAEEAEKELKDPDPITLACLALVRKGEAAAVARAAEALEKGLPEFRAAGRALRTGRAADLEEALDAALNPHWKAPLLALLARRFPDRAAKLNGLARRLNVLPAFPYHLVRRATAE